MKETIKNNVYGLLIIASFALVITSCQKEKNDSSNTSNYLGNVNANVAIPKPAVPFPTLAAPAGNRFFLQTFARGVQIYEVQRSAADPSTCNVW